MTLTDRVLLRLHIEAVWGVQLPPIVASDVELLQGGSQPSWKLCAAEMHDDRVNIWRPDIGIMEREALLACVNEALTLPPTAPLPPDINREIALHQTASPTMDMETAQRLARSLTPHDQPLVEDFQAGSVAYYFDPQRFPLTGVVVNGRLLSLAHSARRTAAACELGIETLPEARRKGYALAATILWAAMVAQEGLVPLYSAFANNTASLALADAAGYRVFARVATIV